MSRISLVVALSPSSGRCGQRLLAWAVGPRPSQWPLNGAGFGQARDVVPRIPGLE
jgi:hypothetical protein